MSDLRPKSQKITLNGKEYGVRCTLGVVDELQDKFDIPISEIGEVLKDERSAIKNIISLLTIMINEDIDIRRDGGETIDNVNERFVARHLDLTRVSEIQEILLSSMMASVSGEGNEEAPNGKSE